MQYRFDFDDQLPDLPIAFDFEEVAKLINLPDDHVLTMFVAIGKGTKEPWDRPGQLSLDHVVVKNSF